MGSTAAERHERVALWKDEGDENIGGIEWSSIRPQDLREMCMTGKWDIDFMAIQGTSRRLFHNEHVLSFIKANQAKILQSCILRPARLSNCRQGLIFAYFSNQVLK